MECPQCGNPNRDGARFCDSCGAPLAATATTPPVADAVAEPDDAALPGLIDGRFEPIESLGTRGAKTVYRARDVAGDGDVALALFDSERMAATAHAQARREAQATEKIGEHPNVVAVIASGDHEGSPYVASEFMAGGDLRADIERLDSETAPLERAIEVASDVCRGLGHIHTRGIVHRDLKPASIWLDDDGRARIGDFGLAISGTGRGGSGVVGTAAYLPPEQALGRPADARADLYSLGCVLYELVTGSPPFAGDDAVAIISQHLNSEPVPVSKLRDGVPAALDATIAALLAKAPDDRPENAKAALRLLEGALEGEPAAAVSPGSAEAGVSALASGVFVGREAELAELRGAVDRLASGRGGLVLLVGEPGIGKTRTAEELATYATVNGARVHWGRCHEDEAAPAYWPWAEALRSHVAEADPVGLRWELGNTAADVARIAPAVAERLELEPRAGAGAEADEDRFRIFDSVTRFLIGVSRARPLVLILDDLHWADEASLTLLRFVSGQLRDSGLLIVGTYRDVELGRHHPLAQTLGELSSADVATRVALHGLDTPGIDALIHRTVGKASPAGLAERVRERTEGNPFFAAEIVRLMASEGTFARDGGRIAIPEGVREVVGRRLDRLGPQANDLLRVAAAVGREFDCDVVAEAAGAAPDAVDEALAAGVGERLVDDARAGADRYCFSHALVRETLYAELSGSARVTTHRKIGLALESRCGDGGEVSVAELAHHFSEAAAAGEAARAVEYSDRAACEAAAQLAHEDTVVHLTSALDALALLDQRDRERELSVRLRLGEAQTRAGRFVDARDTLIAAARAAREIGDSDSFARATLALASLSPSGFRDEEIAMLANEALERVGPEPSGTRSRLLSALAGEEFWDDAQGVAAPMAREALEMARAAGDPAAEAMALAMIQLVTFGADGAHERIDSASRLLEVAELCGDRGMAVRAHAYRCSAYLELGEVAAADRELAAYTEIAEQLREPRHLWHIPAIRANRAIMEGRFDDAWELAAEAFAGSQRAQEPLGIQFNIIQRSILYVAQGRVEEMLPEVRRMTELYPAVPAWRMALVSFLCEADRTDEARPEFELVAANNFEDIPKDLIWLGGMTRLADAAADLGDERRAATLYRVLLPFSGLAAVIGRAVACNGPVDLYLGRLALTNGRPDDAVRHIEAAVELTIKMGDRTWMAQAKRRLGEALLTRDGPGDRARAIETLGEAIDIGQETGMRRVVERALALRLEAQGVEVGAVGDPIDDVIESMADAELEPDGGAEERVTILFSDIESSTLMTERLGDERWIEVLRAHNEIFRGRLAEHGGSEVKNQGDGFMLAFDDPVDALEFAIGVQLDLAGREEADDERVRVRMGMHVGEVIAEDGDYFGRSVILAARIAAQARGGEVLVSSDCHEAVAGGERFGFESGRELELKGLAGSHTVYPADWESVRERALA